MRNIVVLISVRPGMPGVEAVSGGHSAQYRDAYLAAHHGLRVGQVRAARGADHQRRRRRRAGPLQVLRHFVPRVLARRVARDRARSQRLPLSLRAE